MAVKSGKNKVTIRLKKPEVDESRNVIVDFRFFFCVVNLYVGITKYKILIIKTGTNIL